ncbi:protein bric-a-brac 1-like [Anthonomus grandis grandis]|uniref:protein bric-a-brac 1-like n=1 Tax=Anthonomus grandis grandis TaxID=2921223 RepID=UPI0021663D86|nr:protein bric-a-brac 1-like [Anthonomus grandis grandis]
METESHEEYSLAWKGHINYLRDSLIRLLHTNELCDVTLYTEGGKIGAHKVLLAACSEYFSDLFKEIKTERPIIVLKGVEYEILLEILKFIYHGEVSIELPKLSAFLDAAQFLRVSGLTKDKVVKSKIVKEININESDQACNTEHSSETQVSASPSYIVSIEENENIADRPPEEPMSFSSIHQSILAKACTVELPHLSKLYKIHRTSKPEQSHFPSIDHQKYSKESPPRTNEWTSDYDNIRQGSTEKSSSEMSSTSNRKKRFKSERKTSLSDISEIDQEECELIRMKNDQSMQKAMLKSKLQSLISISSTVLKSVCS